MTETSSRLPHSLVKLSIGLAAAAAATGCGSEARPGDPPIPDRPQSVAHVRECLRLSGSYPEPVPSIRGLAAMNALVRRAQRDRGAVRTPPPDPTHSGFVVAYFLVFGDRTTAQDAASAGRNAVLEFRERLESSIRGDADYEIATVQGNVLTLYLQDPSGAEGQRDAIEACLGEPGR